MEKELTPVLYKRSFFSKIVVTFGSSVLVVAGAFGVSVSIEATLDLGTLLLALFSLGFGVLGLISLFRYRIGITNIGIHKVDIAQRLIEWDEIDEIEYIGSEIRVRGGGKKISIDRDIGDRSTLIRMILARIDKDSVRLTGPGWSGEGGASG
jgi:hypothetical protein